MVGLPTLLSEKAKGCLKSVYRENTFGRSMYLLYQQYYSVHLGQCCQDSLTVQHFKVKVQCMTANKFMLLTIYISSCLVLCKGIKVKLYN